MRCLKYLSAALLVMSAVGVAVAAPAPWNAGSKIFQPQDQRTVSRRAYSYAPSSATPAPTVTSNAQAPAAAAAASAAPSVQTQPRSYRSYSYRPGTSNRRANYNRPQFWKEQR